ncbi:NADPH-dependent ferric siderophore reductase [Leucobacter exalbidus]|uniref:NADPH-dependent ferric siderophore reductase n=1 Tax=Leucobacter exalbidus TaxID=662960 RepID=A0A940PM68_9MICO|nr:NADPH-dependent ferric siderophore reductase [Leucobacter exalbidus]
MTDSTAPVEFPFVIARATVQTVEVLSPSFVRISFGGPELADFGTPGSSFDQRIKLIFPPAEGEFPDLSSAGSEWYQAWLAFPEERRGAMRTYSVRDLIVEGDATTLVVDFVLHLSPGASGPASSWAAQAAAGDDLLIFGPRRGLLEGGGIEYTPGTASTVLLAGDETAAPAIARIIEDLAGRDDAPQVRAFIEVPEAGDRLDIAAAAGCEVHWLPRDGKATGTVLIPAVLQHLGALSDGELTATGSVEIVDVEGEELVWETPQYSRLGEQPAVSENHAESYFWIAGESGTVTTLRRHLVRDLGINRAQVAFMGYWRKGVAMRG